LLAVQVVPPVQAWPQVPQLALSEVVSTHAPVQSVRPEPHEPAQRPELHTSPDAHAWPQVPQLAGSELTSTQADEHTMNPAVPQTQVLFALQVNVLLGQSVLVMHSTHCPVTVSQTGVEPVH